MPQNQRRRIQRLNEERLVIDQDLHRSNWEGGGQMRLMPVTRPYWGQQTLNIEPMLVQCWCLPEDVWSSLHTSTCFTFHLTMTVTPELPAILLSCQQIYGLAKKLDRRRATSWGSQLLHGRGAPGGAAPLQVTTAGGGQCRICLRRLLNLSLGQWGKWMRSQRNRCRPLMFDHTI